KGIVTSRLVLRRASPDDAGNYTCVFRNLQGSISSSIVLAAPQPQNYLCNYKNVTYCLNGGTCVISRITNKPSCQCPEEYMGFFCENINIEYMYREQIRQSLIRNLAVAGVSETTLSTTTLVAGLALIALFVVLLAICCMVADIRRRLDRKHWTVPAGKRSSDEEPEQWPNHVAVPTAAAEPRRSHNSGAAGGGAPLSYTYRTPGPSSSQPVEFRIQPVFNYATAAAGTSDAADNLDDRNVDGEAIDLLKEFKRVELLQQQQQQQQQQAATTTTTTAATAEATTQKSVCKATAAFSGSWHAFICFY
uniref:EGF-like domain-containing protein n=1 Tax=Macrostomum lignano TaxID=282301 RepID=A0A1I8H3C4_9PLAT